MDNDKDTVVLLLQELSTRLDTLITSLDTLITAQGITNDLLSKLVNDLTHFGGNG